MVAERSLFKCEIYVADFCYDTEAGFKGTGN